MADFREMTCCFECAGRPWIGRRPWHFISLCKLLVPWEFAPLSLFVLPAPFSGEACARTRAGILSAVAVPVRMLVGGFESLLA
jgi:hypothetical protein